MFRAVSMSPQTPGSGVVQPCGTVFHSPKHELGVEKISNSVVRHATHRFHRSLTYRHHFSLCLPDDGLPVPDAPLKVLSNLLHAPGRLRLLSYDGRGRSQDPKDRSHC